jgi:hypothetical protein
VLVLGTSPRTERTGAYVDDDTHLGDRAAHEQVPEPPDALLRPLGALERMYHRFSELHPMQFVVAAHFRGTVDATGLQDALATLQQHHPSFAARVMESESGPVIATTDEPIPVRSAAPGTAWETEAARELADAFTLRPGAPTVRAVLIDDDGSDRGAMVLLTFVHSLADGLSGALLLGDLARALSHEELGPRTTSESRETALKRVPAVDAVVRLGPPDGPPPLAHEELRALPVFRPFDGRRPAVYAQSLDETTTAELLGAARRHGTTLHGALIAAAGRAATRTRGIDFVRTMSPISLLPFVGTADGPGVFIAVARTGGRTGSRDSFWAEARDHVAALAPARSAGGVGRSVAAIGAAMDAGVTAARAEAFMARGALGLDVVVSNLGVLRFPVGGEVQVDAFWGPLVLTQVDGEQMLGAATTAGRLALVATGYDMSPDFLPAVVTALRAAIDDGR